MPRLTRYSAALGIAALVLGGGAWGRRARNGSRFAFRPRGGEAPRRGEATISASGTLEPMAVGDVGGGIMNIMLRSVTERARASGLRMAVGARSRDILRQFLVEAVAWCLAGGVAGILLGRGVSIAVTAMLAWPTLPSVPAIIAAVAVAFSVGIIFGIFPVWKASELDPIEALRFE